ncbi:MAG: hypothetical protein E7Z99_04740 [Coriobacteriaceae bacterium]|nr:hypothetical protein [Coriobacteriaceae bacterium]
MSTEKKKLIEMPPEAPHKNLRRGVGATIVSGCLVLTMLPAAAFAVPGDTPRDPGQTGQAPFAQDAQFGDMQQNGYGGQPDGGQAPQQPSWGDSGAPGAEGQQQGGYPQFDGEQPSGQPDASMQPDGTQGPGQGEASQQPADGQQPGDGQQLGRPGDGQQPPVPIGQVNDLVQRVYDAMAVDGEAHPIADVMQQLTSGMQGIVWNQFGIGQQPAQPGGEQNGQQPGQPGGEQAGQPGGQQPGQQNGQQPPMTPERMREILQSLYGILGIDAEANPIEDMMHQMMSSMQNAMTNPFGFGGQPGQQPGQPGQQPGQPGQQPGQPGGSNGAPTSYDAANKLDTSADGGAYKSTADNENAVLVDGKAVTLSNFTVEKTGSASGENADFYGTNAGILANNGANLTIDGATVTTDGAHANGVFSYGSGTSVAISNSTITTTGNNSGGLMTTGGASLSATNMTVNTTGNSSAAIRTDRGGGTVTASQGTYSTSGVGSPAIYSTADVTVSDATLSATNSEAVVIEGGNSVTLRNANVTGSNAKLNGQSTVKTNVLIYQSMSGDASEGASSFTMAGGSLTSLTGSMFHVTNTTTTIDLSGVTLANAPDSSDFLIATADAWGTSGRNGGHATVNLTSQAASGNITVDSVSSVALNLKGNSSYEGAISNDGTVDVTIEAGSTWTLTGDSYVSSLSNAGSINLNGHALYVNGVAYAG